MLLVNGVQHDRLGVLSRMENLEPMGELTEKYSSRTTRVRGLGDDDVAKVVVSECYGVR